MYSEITTLTGMSLEEALRQLDEQLPEEAYSPVPGPVVMTDIDPNWMRLTLNKVFGVCGYGWGYDFDPADLDLRYEERDGRCIYVAIIKKLRLWYKLNHIGTTYTCDVVATGASQSNIAAHALKGAVSNALGHAVSNIGFQQSVYLGKRNHLSVRGNGVAPKFAPVPAEPAPDPATATDPAPAPDAPAPEVVVVHFGKMKGKTIADIAASGKEGEGWLKWAAESFQPKSQQDFRLKQAVQAFLAQQSVHP
jgi:hypothetical protein